MKTIQIYYHRNMGWKGRHNLIHTHKYFFEKQKIRAFEVVTCYARFGFGSRKTNYDRRILGIAKLFWRVSKLSYLKQVKQKALSDCAE